MLMVRLSRIITDIKSLMKIFIASDHAAYQCKQALFTELACKYEVIDLGTNSEESTDYPIYAKKLCEQVLKNPEAKGILICGSGIGVSMVANRYRGIRAALCRDSKDALLSRQHNNANVLCLGGRSSSAETIQEIVQVWLQTNFEGGRHQKRIDQFNDLGEKNV